MATLPASGIAQDRKRLLPAAAIALVAEALVLGVAIALLTHTARLPAVSQQAPPTLLTLAAPAAAPQPTQPPQPVAKPVPMHPAAHTPMKPVSAAGPKPMPAPAPTPTPAPAQPAATPTEPPTTSAPQPSAQPARQAPAAAAAPVAAAPTASFEGALRAAIQAALRYPESARMAGMTGRTRVAFRYRDGVVSDLNVVVSSGIGLLDRAALAAVRDAAYPKPEPAFVGKTLSEQLWVDFNLDDHE
ncbi:TonB family protein [Paraburkholderia sp. HD33-4]|uniref:TonB family protein n=1 Tax=Paraburkholderia sp. HD33-4 TaxID=2883242 RepID=UPI001F229A92|nr:TonB family protein [Paraburkholderia sp. HD33-4]